MTHFKPMSRRRFMQTAVAASSVATMGSALTACGETATGPNVTIKYWDWFVTQGPWVDNEISLFHKAHPNITVKKTTQVVAQYANLYALSIKSGNTPDIAMIPQSPIINTQMNQGWYLPIDKWANNTWRSKFPEGTFHEGSNIFGGKLYTAPLNGSGPWCQLYINNKVFKDAGIVNADGSVKVPQTWDDVTQAAEAIKKKGPDDVYGLGFGNGSGNNLKMWLHVFLLGAGSPGGGYGLDVRTGKWTVASDPNYANFIKLWKSWKDKGYFYANSMSATDEAVRNFFSQGKIGMIVTGVWSQPEWTAATFTDYSINTLISPKTTRQGYFPTSPGGSFIGISAKTKHPEEAWAWFDWIYSVDAGKRWVSMGEDLSVFPQNNDPKNIKFKPFANFVALSNLGVPAPDISVRNPDTSFVQPQDVKPGIDEIMAGYYTGQVPDIEAALADLQTKLQKAQDDAILLAQQQGHKVSASDYAFPDWDTTKPYITKPAKA